MPKITFFLRSNNDQSNTHSLYCRVTYKNTKTEFSTKEKVSPDIWSQSSQRCIGKTAQSKYLESLTETICYNLKTTALYSEYLTAKDLVNAFKGGKKKQGLRLDVIIEDYILSVKNKVSEGTLRNHSVKLKNLRDYEKDRGIFFTPELFTIVEAEKFKVWFMNRAKTDRVDTANRNVLLYRKAMIYAQKKGDITQFELLHYVGEKDPVPKTIFLTSNELQKLARTNFVSGYMERIRDLFLFQCTTGLSYADLWNDWEIKDTEAGVILSGRRKKNAQLFFVPLCESARYILDKYDGKLPEYHNNVYNRMLKEIAEYCNIDKRLTTHTARKTFATLKDAEGWSRETLSKMLGHKSIRTTETHYLGTSSKRLEYEMIQRRIGS